MEGAWPNIASLSLFHSLSLGFPLFPFAGASGVFVSSPKVVGETDFQAVPPLTNTRSLQQGLSYSSLRTTHTHGNVRCCSAKRNLPSRPLPFWVHGSPHLWCGEEGRTLQVRKATRLNFKLQVNDTYRTGNSSKIDQLKRPAPMTAICRKGKGPHNIQKYFIFSRTTPATLRCAPTPIFVVAVASKIRQKLGLLLEAGLAANQQWPVSRHIVMPQRH